MTASSSSLEGDAWRGLAGLPGVLACTTAGGRVRVVVDDARKRLPEIFRHLDERGVAGERRDRDRADAGVGLHRARAMSGLATPAARVRLVRRQRPLRRELVKVSAFFLRNWRMTYRNAFTIFEIVFWPMVNLLSVGLLITFLEAEPGTVVFVLVGTFALSTVQVCQLDVAYAALFDMWAKSIKHQLVAPDPALAPRAGVVADGAGARDGGVRACRRP